MNQDSKPSNFDENGMRTLLEDVLDEKMKNIMQNIGNNTSTTNEQIPNKNVSKNEFKGNAEVKKASDLEYEFSKTKGSYLLVFMDIQMPEMNGLDATRAIRALDDPWASSIPIVAMTADAFSEMN